MLPLGFRLQLLPRWYRYLAVTFALIAFIVGLLDLTDLLVLIPRALISVVFFILLVVQASHFLVLTGSILILILVVFLPLTLLRILSRLFPSHIPLLLFPPLFAELLLRGMLHLLRLGLGLGLFD